MKDKNKGKVKEANLFADFVVDLAQAQKEVNGMMLIEHPEDLGRAPRGDPGSIWRWPRVRALVSGAWRTGALHQASWGSSFAKPTRFIFYLPGFEESVRLGWPVFGDGLVYKGPLDRCSATALLKGRSDGNFITKQAEGWPKDLCEHLADLVWKNFENLKAEAPAVGVEEVSEEDGG